MRSITKITTMLAAAGMWSAVAAFGAYDTGVHVDLSTANASGTINGAIFTQITEQPTGSGVFQPFVRINPGGGYDAEAGYNTSGRIGTKAPLQDDMTLTYTHDLALSSLKPVNGYYTFTLDINQNKGGDGELLSLNSLEVFLTSQPSQTTESMTAYKLNLANATVVYDMNAGQTITDGSSANNNVKLNYALDNGSGMADITVKIPVANFVGKAGETYVVLFSQFGNPPGTYPSNDGYEEWAANISAVPEPTTVLAGLMLLLPFGASAFRIIRNRK